ncbi:hypothetical protein GQX73_g9818 [Xylaria multiplex]|uniref:Ubiquitin-like domain-containing protein n=1 Tax=Xylaria multiplex TaxID=323545 RepID=A0A7C8MN97_9PEZI|nr:hypothetical protein GQX73_g9818 [Xylaria multiplex]
MLSSSGPSLVTVDLLANRSDPLDPPDLSDRRRSRLGPTSPIQQTPEGDAEGTAGLTASSDDGQGGSMSRKDTADDNDGIVVDDGGDTSSRSDKGKAPETARLVPASTQIIRTNLYEEASHNVLQAENPSGASMEDEYAGTSANASLAGTATNEEDSEISNRSTQPESQDSSYPSSLFEEEQDNDAATTTPALVNEATSWKQKQKQKADPQAETGSSSEASGEEKPYRPPNVGDPGWEKSAGRPPQKLPVRFRDAVGRNFLFPWEKAKTWAGMRRLVNSCFVHVDVLGPHVMAGRYDLSINLPFPMDAASEMTSPVTPLTPVSTQASTSAAGIPSSFTVAGSSSAPGPSGNANPPQQQQQPRSSFVVLPELWEDTIEPGMLVVQHMWPFQTPNYVAQPVQPSPPQSHHHLPPGPAGYPAGRGRGARGRGRGAGAGAGMFGGRGGVGGNMFPPPPHPHLGARPPITVPTAEPPHRGKTRKRQDKA